MLAASPDVESAANALSALPARTYNPFNLFVSDGVRAFVAVYEDAPSVTELGPGAHVIGNADPNDRDHPKVSRILREAEGVAAGSSARALDALAEICRSHAGGAENPLAQTCIHLRGGEGASGSANPAGYGTRSSMLYKRGTRPEEASFLWSEGKALRERFRRSNPPLARPGSDDRARSRGQDEERGLRRIGSNIRKQNQEAKQNRLSKNIIRYKDDEKPRNEYPKRIISPSAPSDCCTDDNKTTVGTVREVDGFKFAYRICDDCGHAVRYFYPAVEGTSDEVKTYRKWKTYMVQ